MAAGLTILVYWGSLYGPFVLDDSAAIAANPTLTTLWPLVGPLTPPAGGLPVSGRPLVNLAFAANRALGGAAPFGYHVGNIILHVLTGLALFAVLRRTLVRPVVSASVRVEADRIAGAVALLWLVHPLCTAAVSYLSQRTELMVSLCYLLTLLGVGKAAEVDCRFGAGGVLALVACWAGMACKEVMVSAPLVALAFDRTFFAGTFRAAWRRRWPLYAGLFASWALLAVLVHGAGDRGGTAGVGLSITPWAYAGTQAVALVRYLRLVFVPYPLVFDHGSYVEHDWRVILPAAIGVGGLLVAAGLAWWRRPALGFAGLMGFALLAPTSSVVPVATQTIGEHRMYLACAVVLAVAVAMLWARLGRRALVVVGLAVLAASVGTVARNADFRSAERLWRDTVNRWPANARAHNNLALELADRGERAAAARALAEAVRLDPRYVDALRNLGRLELEGGRAEQALPRLTEAQRLDPGLAEGWALLGRARFAAGHPEEAAHAWREALRLRPGWAEAYVELGHVLLAGGRTAEALGVAREAARLQPTMGAAWVLGGDCLFALDRFDDSVAAYRRAVALDSGDVAACCGLGNALLALERPAEALAQFDTARRLGAGDAALLCSRALALAGLGRFEEARNDLREALRLSPGYAPAEALLRALEAGAGDHS